MNNRLVDPDGAGPTSEHYAVVKSSSRSRKRFAESCVTLFADRQSAMDEADPAQQLRAARVFGPSRSSEGVRLFYLVEWL